jgi:hypothetical protein
MDEMQENEMQFGADMVKKYSDVCQSFKRECNDIDELLRFIGLEPHRTDGGSLNMAKIKLNFLAGSAAPNDEAPRHERTPDQPEGSAW